MNLLMVLLFSGFFCVVAFIIFNMKIAIADSKESNLEADEKEQAKALSLCQKDESLKVVCRANKGTYYILTDKRLMIDSPKKGMTFVPLDMIVRVQFYGSGMGEPRNSNDCNSFYVYASNREVYKFFCYSKKFYPLCDYFFSRQGNSPRFTSN